MINMTCGTRLGRRRNFWGIRAQMDELGLTQRQVAAHAGVHHSLVGKTLRGNANNRRVLAALLELGINPNYLSLPDDLRGVAA